MYLRDIIYSITGHKIIPVNIQEDQVHRNMVMYLKQSLKRIKNNMIFYAKRPNDVSNNTCLDTPCLEETIVNEFNKISEGLQANWLSGSGYPDIEITDPSDTPVGYVEVKATARANMHSPRDFYVSPGRVISVTSSKSSNGGIQFNIQVLPRLTSYKIRGDAPHLMVLAKIQQLQSCDLPRGMSYECKCWKVIEFSLHDLYSLKLKTKVEFNTDYYGIISDCPQL